MKKLLYRLPSSRSFTKLFSLLAVAFAAFVALELFFVQQALAYTKCCKPSTSSTTTCYCQVSTTCSGTYSIKAGTCPNPMLGSTGGSINFWKSHEGQVASCDIAQGTVSAFPGDASLGQEATWNEQSENMECKIFPDTDGNGIPDAGSQGSDSGHFALNVTYTFQGQGGSGGSVSTNVSQPVCDNNTGKLTYEAFCPSVEIDGTLSWVGKALDESAPNWTRCSDFADPDDCVMKLGGFRKEKGSFTCLEDFKDQTSSGGSLIAGQVLKYTEFYLPNTNCTGAQIDIGEGSRRFCDNDSFDPNSTNGPCAPVKLKGQTLTHSGGANPNDKTVVDELLLAVDQWRPTSTINVGCSATDPNLSNGNQPTVILDAQNFDPDNMVLASLKTPVAYVTGFPDDSSPAVRFKEVTGGQGIDFDGCRGANLGLNGIVQVICRHQDAWINGKKGEKSVELTIEGTLNSGLGFRGITSPVKLVADCKPGSFEQP